MCEQEHEIETRGFLFIYIKKKQVSTCYLEGGEKNHKSSRR